MNTHALELVQNYPTGAQEWRCPTCDRHFVMRTEPVFKRIILNEGDPTASHSGSRNGVHIGLPSAPATDGASPDADGMSPELRDALNEFLSGLDENGRDD